MFFLGILVGVLITAFLGVSVIDNVVKGRILSYYSGMTTEQAIEWMKTKNPGIQLRKPVELEFNDFVTFVKETYSSDLSA